MAAKEFKENQDNVQVVFSGIGTKWLSELTKPDNMLHETYTVLRTISQGHVVFVPQLLALLAIRGCVAYCTGRVW